MDWATNTFGEHVKAGTPGALGHALRCPECKAGVYHRSGVYNRPHFAHFSGNSNRACELYYPNVGDVGGTVGSVNRWLVPADREAPALVWMDEELASLSLRLRLPTLPKGYASSLTVSTPTRRNTFPAEDLSRPRFVLLPLREPPATIETNPLDSAIEMRIEAVLGQFRLSGNFFRSTVRGGVLESPGTALELGEEYFYVSQRPLAVRHPNALAIIERREHREWSVYRIRLRDEANTRSDDISDLGSYLGRCVVPAKPQVDIIWPPGWRFDPDGTAVFSSATRELIAHTSGGSPRVETGSRAVATIFDLGEEWYRIAFAAAEEEAVVWMPRGGFRRLRFEEVLDATPRGVTLTSLSGTADLVSQAAHEVASDVGSIEMSVPSERLWRSVLVDGRKLNPVPNGAVHTLVGPLQDVRVGGFGYLFNQRAPSSERSNRGAWHSKIERVVSASVGPVAMGGLKKARSRYQVTRWAIDNNSLHLLPLVLCAFSSGAGRGIP
jgi:hypothetical protein